MQTECSAQLLDFAPAGRQEVVESLDATASASDADALPQE
jgi:hypothetical protein